MNASLFSTQRIDLFYCLDDETRTTDCVFLFGARELRAKPGPFVTIRDRKLNSMILSA